MIIATKGCDNSQKRCEFSQTLLILYQIMNKLFTKIAKHKYKIIKLIN